MVIQYRHYRLMITLFVFGVIFTNTYSPELHGDLPFRLVHYLIVGLCIVYCGFKSSKQGAVQFFTTMKFPLFILVLGYSLITLSVINSVTSTIPFSGFHLIAWHVGTLIFWFLIQNYTLAKTGSLSEALIAPWAAIAYTSFAAGILAVFTYFLGIKIELGPLTFDNVYSSGPRYDRLLS